MQDKAQGNAPPLEGPRSSLLLEERRALAPSRIDLLTRVFARRSLQLFIVLSLFLQDPSPMALSKVLSEPRKNQEQQESQRK